MNKMRRIWKYRVRARVKTIKGSEAHDWVLRARQGSSNIAKRYGGDFRKSLNEVNVRRVHEPKKMLCHQQFHGSASSEVV